MNEKRIRTNMALMTPLEATEASYVCVQLGSGRSHSISVMSSVCEPQVAELVVNSLCSRHTGV